MRHRHAISVPPRAERGTSSVEFAAVVVLFFVMVLGITDFARALWQWNLAARATQVGVRAAAVQDPAALNVRHLDGTLTAPIGEAVPAAALTPNPTLCTRDGCGAALSALDPALLDGAAFARIVAPMRAVNRRIDAGKVILEYRHVGLGLAGNPEGPDIDPLITVRLRELRFEFLGIGFLGLPAIELPDFRATLSAEDGDSA